MSDICISCGTFDNRCNCFAGNDSAALPCGDAVVPSDAPTTDFPPVVGAPIAGESGVPVSQAHPSYKDLAVAVEFCANMLMLRRARSARGSEASDPQLWVTLDRWGEQADLAFHAAGVLRGFEAGAL